MPDERIEDLSGGELTAPSPTDLFVVLDRSDGTEDPDGTTKNIEYQNLFAFGEISVEGNATTTSPPNTTDFSSAGTSGQVVIFGVDSADAPESNVDADHTSGHIAVTNAGTYFIHCNISFNGSTGKSLSFALFKNDGATQLGGRTTRKLGSSDIGACSVSALATLAANDTVELWCQNETDTSTITIEDCSLSVMRVG